MSGNMYFYLSVLGLLTMHAHASVLLQVSRDSQNRSNVDALIHKVVPAEIMERFAAKMSRKRYPVRGVNMEKVRFKTHDLDMDEPRDGVVQRRIKKIIERRPILRSKTFQFLKPAVINFRSNNQNKPSLMYQVNSETLIRAMKEFLSSQIVSKYTDEMAKHAAFVYRSIQDQ